MSAWQKISTPDDFPSVDVYERQGPLSKDYRIAFRNMEREEDKTRIAFIAAVSIFLICAPAASFFGRMVFEWIPMGAVLFFFALFVFVFPVWFWLVKDPKRKHRAIELDFNSDELRVLRTERFSRTEKLVDSRKLSRLADVSVDDHPDTEWERETRRRHNRAGPGRFEKSHCLFGHFGEGGAERLILVTREEWPKRHSLYEVQQAVAWAFNQGAKDVKAQQAAEQPSETDWPGSDESPEPGPKSGIKPPLD